MIRPGIRRFLRLRLGRRADAARQVEEEIGLHIELRVEQLLARGLSPSEARREAERRFGVLDRARRSLQRSATRRDRRMTIRDRMQELSQDVRYAIRGLAREPHFATMVVLTLALGIGANAAMFGIVDRLLLRGLEHVRAPEHVVRLYLTVREPGEGEQTTWTHSYAEYVAQRDRNRAFSAVGAYAFGDDVLGRGTETERIRTGYATPDFFTVLGVQPRLGRFIGAEDDRPPRGERVLVLSHGLWQRQFGGAASAIGQDLTLNGDRYTVIGVAPKGFTGAQLEPVAAWLPMTVRAHGTSAEWQTTWSVQSLRIIARVRAVETPERIAAGATAAHRGGYTGREEGQREARISGAPLRYDSDAREPTELSVSRWLVGVSAIVLLIACANVANLLLVRVVRRRREIAIRVVLGVTRSRLARLLLTESLMLAGLGALAGLAVAYWSGQFVRVLLLPEVEWSSPPLDLRVLMFSMLAAVVTGLLIGLLPVIQAARTGLSSSLKTTAREGGGRRSRVRNILTMAQAALSVVLLIGAGLFVRSLWNVRHLDLGIEPERVLVVVPRYPSLSGLDDADAQRERARRTTVLDEAVETLGRLTGIANATSVVGTPFRSSFTIELRVPGYDSLPRLPGGGPYVAAVQPGYFVTVGTPLLRGREFTTADRAGSEPVAMVNQTMARTLWPQADAIGQCINIGDEAQTPCARIVGMVADARRFGLREPPAMQYYVPLGQEKGFGGRNILVRPSGDPQRVIPALRAALAKLDPAMMFVNVETLQQSLDPQVRPWRLGATMFALFGGLALLIAAIGLYSVIAYLVAQRLHEFGVRLALGAGAQHIRKLIVGHGAMLCLGGAAIGMLIALAAGRFLEDLLFETSPRDPTVFLAVGLTLLAVALVATVLPARRAARVDPATVLRSD